MSSNGYAPSRINGNLPVRLLPNGQIDQTNLPPEVRFKPDAIRSFLTGPALVMDHEKSYGHPDEFSPEMYGHYAATSDIVYAAIKMRASNLASVPLRLYRGVQAGDAEPVEAHPSIDLLNYVNAHWSYKRLMRMTEWALGLWGESFWFITRGDTRRGTPTEIWWARPDRVRVVPDADDYIAGFIYEVNGERIPFSVDETVWIPLENPIDEFSGLSPIASGRLGIDTSRQAMLANHQMHVNGARISGILSPANSDVSFQPDDIHKLTEMFKTLKGASNAHKMAVMNKMARFDQLTLAPKDAEYLGQLRWSVGVVSRIFSVAPELLGDHERATYSNMDQAYKALWTDAVIPEATFIADELTEKYLPKFGPGSQNLYLEFDFSDVSVLQEDQTEITQQASVWIDRGVPLNKVLQETAPQLLPEGGEGYAWGDVPIWEAKAAIQAQYMPDMSGGDGSQSDEEPPGAPGTVAGQKDTVGADDPPRSALALVEGMIDQRCRQVEIGSPEHHARSRRFNRQVERHERRFAEAISDMFRRQRDSVVTKLQQRSAQRDAMDVESAPFDRAEWEAKWRQMVLPFLQEILQDGAFETLDELGVMVDFNLDNPLTIEWLRDATQKFAKQINETTWETLKQAIGDGINAGDGIEQLTDRVQQVMDQASQSRSRTIARTETVRASNAGGIQAARDSGIVRRKIWLSALDERVRETHIAAHGQERGLEEDFSVGSASGPAPGDMSTASESVNCRCTLIWELDDGRLVVPSVMRMER